MDCSACKNFRWGWYYDDRYPVCKKQGSNTWCNGVAGCPSFEEKQSNQ